MTNGLSAGAAVVDITPKNSQFLYGYPHVKRFSTGVHDPLMSSALYLADGRTKMMFLANDVIFINKKISWAVRQRVEEKTGIPARNIIISATHTHSGPITVNYISNKADAAVPKADEQYIHFLEDRMVEAAVQAVHDAEKAKVGLLLVSSDGIGTNRHDPTGPADHQVPVLIVRATQSDSTIACMLVCSMHPTVLHEDSTLISADFPGMTRSYLQKTGAIGKGCPILYHTGPSGNQSPRHVTTGNTFSEAERLGQILGESIIQALPGIEYTSNMPLHCFQKEFELPRRVFPTVEAAQLQLDQAYARLNRLRLQKGSHQEIRTAECDWFGAEESLTLAKAFENGTLEAAYHSCIPAEIQIFQIGPWIFAGWPGEIFVEYSLAVKNLIKNAFIISLSNGELQGYIVTEEAAVAKTYEASNALFSCRSGQILIDETVNTINKIRAKVS